MALEPLRIAKSLVIWFAGCSLSCLTACGSDAADEGGKKEGAGSQYPLGVPIDVAPSEQWVWVPIEGTMCADGTEAGVGVNFTTQSRELVIFFQGNGVCYDQATCSFFQKLLTGMGPDPLDH